MAHDKSHTNSTLHGLWTLIPLHIVVFQPFLLHIKRCCLAWKEKKNKNLLQVCAAENFLWACCRETCCLHQNVMAAVFPLMSRIWFPKKCAFDLTLLFSVSEFVMYLLEELNPDGTDIHSLFPPCEITFFVKTLVAPLSAPLWGYSNIFLELWAYGQKQTSKVRMCHIHV